MFKLWKLSTYGRGVTVDVCDEGGIPVRIGSVAMSFRPRRFAAKRGEHVRYDKFSEQDQALLRLIAQAPRMYLALREVEEIIADTNQGSSQAMVNALHQAIKAARNGMGGVEIPRVGF